MILINLKFCAQNNTQSGNNKTQLDAPTLFRTQKEKLHVIENG